MKQFKLTFLLTVLMSMVGVKALAHDIEVPNVNGVTIYYVWTNNNTELAVSYRGDIISYYSDKYTGNVVIPESVIYNGNSYKVTSINSYAFYYCSGLSSITLPNSVTSIGEYAFYYCSGLISITLPNSVTSIDGYTFSGCSGLISLTIPNSVTYIGEHAFSSCSGLSSITIPNSVTSIGSSAFSDCSGLSSITIPNSVTSIGISAFSRCSGLSSITIPNSVTSIGISAFSYTSWYKNQPDGLIYLGKVAYKYKGTMPGNTSIIISEETVSITGEAFSQCSGLSSITIPNSVTSIGSNAFSGCSGLSSITIPNSVTSIGGGAFYDCKGLTSITLPNSLTFIGEATFWCCSSLSSITIPNSVTNIESGAFYGCSSLTSVHISDLEAWCKINFYGEYSNPVFYAHKLLLNNEEIKDYKYPDNTTSINNYVFIGCSSLTSVTIPNSVTYIGQSAFSGCSGLASVTIPNSVTYIGYGAFDGCRLENVYTKNSSLQFQPSTFSDRTYQHAMLYIPEGTWGNAVYDGDWYLFNNIRELASKTEMLSPSVAYALIDVNSFGYAVYNEGNESVENVKAFYSVDDSDPNNFWQIVNKEEGKCLYNIGAKKYLAVSADGQFSLTDVPVVLKLSDTQDGIIIDGNTRQWVFSKNYNVSVVNTLPKGDVNGDIKVGIGDIITVTNVMAGEGTEEIIKRADVNGDGEVGIGDIITITNIMAGE